MNWIISLCECKKEGEKRMFHWFLLREIFFLFGSCSHTQLNLCNPWVKQARLFIFSVLISNYQEIFCFRFSSHSLMTLLGQQFILVFHLIISFHIFCFFFLSSERGKIMIFNHNMFAFKHEAQWFNFNPRRFYFIIFVFWEFSFAFLSGLRSFSVLSLAAVNKTLRTYFLPRLSFELVMQLLEWKLFVLLSNLPFFGCLGLLSLRQLDFHRVHSIRSDLIFNRLVSTFNPYLIFLSRRICQPWFTFSFFFSLDYILLQFSSFLTSNCNRMEIDIKFSFISS